jgi:hypothetical protein
MAISFFKENGSMIKSDDTIVTLKLDTTTPHNTFHNLVVSTKLSGIGLYDDTQGVPKDPNTIFIKEADAIKNILLFATTPELYFTAVDLTDISLNIKFKVDATKTNHAGKSFFDLMNETDKGTDEV